MFTELREGQRNFIKKALIAAGGAMALAGTVGFMGLNHEVQELKHREVGATVSEINQLESQATRDRDIQWAVIGIGEGIAAATILTSTLDLFE